ncbi:MAG: hypothetical protein AAFX85_11825, partial [Pseudomonadota bacterium]
CEGEDCPQPCQDDGGDCAPPPCGDDRGCDDDRCDDRFDDYYDPFELGALTWAVSEGQLVITYQEENEAGEAESFTETITLVSRTSEIVNVTIDSMDEADEGDDAGEGESDGENGEEDEDNGRELKTAVRIGLDPNGFDATSIAGTYIPTTVESEEVIVFLADGSGYEIDLFTGAQEESFTWAVAEGLLTITFQDGETTEVRLLLGSRPDRLQLLIIDIEADGTVDEMFVETVNYTSDIATGPLPDAANTARLTGQTYVELEADSRALFSFLEDSEFREIYQRTFEGEEVEIGEDFGTWSVDEQGVIRVAFDDEDDGDDTTGDADSGADGGTGADGTGADGTGDASDGEDDGGGAAAIVEGLGEDIMTIQTLGDEGEESRAIRLTRVEEFEPAEMIGSWVEQSADGTTTAVITFNEDGTGSYEDQFGGGLFEWTLTGRGTLLLFPEPDPSADGAEGPVGIETITFYKLADSTDDQFHGVLVFRLDGELDGDFDVGPEEEPNEAITEMFLSPANF